MRMHILQWRWGKLISFGFLITSRATDNLFSNQKRWKDPSVPHLVWKIWGRSLLGQKLQVVAEAVSDVWGCYFSAALSINKSISPCVWYFTTVNSYLSFLSCRTWNIDFCFLFSPNPLRKPSSVLSISTGYLFHQLVAQRGWEQLFSALLISTLVTVRNSLRAILTTLSSLWNAQVCF